MNMRSRILLLASTFAAIVAPRAFAQQADITACMAVENDRDRLACYDDAAHREAPTPAAADAAATEAKQQLKALDESNPRGSRSDLYASEPGEAIANAGKGSLLDRRWELAKGSKLGTWNFRATSRCTCCPRSGAAIRT